MDVWSSNREVEKPKKPKASERREQLLLRAATTADMLTRRADGIALTLGHENPLRLDLLATKEMIVQLSHELLSRR